MIKCSTELSIRETTSKTTAQHSIASPPSECLNPKDWVTNTGKHVQKQGLLHIIGWNVNECSHWGKQHRGLKNEKWICHIIHQYYH